MTVTPGNVTRAKLTTVADHELHNALMSAEPSDVIDAAITSCEVFADLESDDAGAWDAWKSIVTKLGELRAQAERLEKIASERAQKR